MSELGTLSIFFIALGLSADCFTVALSGSISMKALSWLQILRTSLTFGIFQAIMPVLGWLLGQTMLRIIAGFDHWIAFALLVLVGGRMIWEAVQKKGKIRQVDITKGFLLILLAIATSIDALAIGLTFAFLEVEIFLAVAIIGLTAFLVTIVSFIIGRKLSRFAGKWAEAIGGIILILIGLRIVLSHVL